METSDAGGWTGEWFDPEIGEQYFIPIDSVNNKNLIIRGIGECVDKRETLAGLSWAFLSFSDGGPPVWVRTCYLEPAIGERISVNTVRIGDTDPMEKATAVWANVESE